MQTMFWWFENTTPCNFGVFMISSITYSSFWFQIEVLYILQELSQSSNKNFWLISFFKNKTIICKSNVHLHWSFSFAIFFLLVYQPKIIANMHRTWGFRTPSEMRAISLFKNCHFFFETVWNFMFLVFIERSSLHKLNWTFYSRG